VPIEVKRRSRLRDVKMLKCANKRMNELTQRNEKYY